MTIDIASLVSDNLDIWTSAVERKSGAGRGGGRRMSPYGADRLRALILDLAIRGKLVPQEPADESASNLLKDFAIQRADRIAKKQMRNGKPLPKVTEREIRFPPPSGWVWTRFFEIGDWGAGATPNRKQSSYYGGETPWFKSGELNADYISEAEETVSELALRECSLRINEPGDVLIAMYGATIGKASILAVRATTNQAVCACTPFKGIGSRFLLLLLKAMRPSFVSQGAGGAQPNISREKIIATPFCLPPSAEQQRIVAKVDELMALCDALEAESAAAMAAHQALVEALLATLTASNDAAAFATNWARLEAHFDALFTTEASVNALERAIIGLAVVGKLTRQNPNEEPALVSLERLARASRRKIELGQARKPKPLNALPVDLPSLPTGWVWTQLGLVAEISPSNSADDDIDASFVPMALVSTKIDGAHQSETRKWGDIKKGFTHFAEGDVAIAKITPCFENGKAAIFENLANGIGAGTTELHVARPWSEDIDRRFILLTMKTEAYLRLGEAGMTGTAGQKRVTRAYFESSPLPLPPIAEQHRIVAKVDAIMALCNQLRTRLADAAQAQRHLADAIVEQAAA
jgi:type I restriction enzyme S subunit